MADNKEGSQLPVVNLVYDSIDKKIVNVMNAKMKTIQST